MLPKNEQRDSFPGLLSDAQRQALRAVFVGFEVTMVACHCLRLSPPWRILDKRCRDSFFVFPVRGHLAVDLGRRRTMVRPGEFLMLDEGIRHHLEMAKGFARLEIFALHCHIHDRWGRSLLSRSSPPFGRLPERKGWWSALRELTFLMAYEPETGQERGRMFVKDLLAWQFRQKIARISPPPEGDPRVSAAIETMEREFSSPDLSMEKLAGSAGITAAQLRRLFLRETGAGPKRFLSDLRLRKAAHLLRGSTASIKEVAAACGFASDHYFHLTFRAAYQCTPSEYRRDR